MKHRRKRLRDPTENAKDKSGNAEDQNKYPSPQPKNRKMQMIHIKHWQGYSKSKKSYAKFSPQRSSCLGQTDKKSNTLKAKKSVWFCRAFSKKKNYVQFESARLNIFRVMIQKPNALKLTCEERKAMFAILSKNLNK